MLLPASTLECMPLDFFDTWLFYEARSGGSQPGPKTRNSHGTNLNPRSTSNGYQYTLIMSLLITGGTGFVLSHVVKLWLEENPRKRLIIVDNAKVDWEAKQFLRNVEGRIQHIVADVLDVETWASEVDQDLITQVIHGAAVSPISTDPDNSPDREDPSRTVRVNVMGTVRVLNWARELPNLRRFLYVSSGVYGYGYKGSATDVPESAIGEDAPLEPGAALYDISKATGEQVVRRFSELYSISSVCVGRQRYTVLSIGIQSLVVFHPVPTIWPCCRGLGKNFS
ncbi:MAG: hypothetical protein CM1200mP39_25570 [Dehalococcoidia bacterium]|nr:MAG: hypothetical protein CM1200mP39_25570 [Dehalococcoidia bacterium]